MLTKYLILILLPALAYGSIKINIKPKQDGKDASVAFSGNEKSAVSDNDRKTFKLGDEILKRASKKYIGKRCGDIYLKPPTPWGDVYKKFGWDIVKRTVKPIEARVVGINSKPVAFGNAEYVNNHDKIDVTYTTSLTHTVEERVSHSWSKGGEAGVGLEIKYEVNFGAASAGGSTTLSYTASWGEETSKSRAVTLGTTSSVLVKVPAKHMARASLQATQGTMKIEVKYKTTLAGRVFCNYPRKYKGHYFYSIPLKDMLNTVGKSVEIISTEIIEIGFYTTARIVVNNGTSYK